MFFTVFVEHKGGATSEMPVVACAFKSPYVPVHTIARLQMVLDLGKDTGPGAGGSYSFGKGSVQKGPFF